MLVTGWELVTYELPFAWLRHTGSEVASGQWHASLGKAMLEREGGMWAGSLLSMGIMPCQLLSMVGFVCCSQNAASCHWHVPCGRCTLAVSAAHGGRACTIP